ncbi:MFS transporter, ACS family, allantoate permease, partial [Tremellales sp. Uapishka_1]
MSTTPLESEKDLEPHRIVEVAELGDLGKGLPAVVDLAARANLVHVEYTAVESKSVLRKIDWRLMPMLIWVYGIQYADKQTLSYSSLMGIRQDIHLNLKSQQYSWAGSIFYAGFLAAEIPATYLMKRLPIGKFLSVNIICWSIVLSCHAAVTNYHGLLACRFLLGFFEASITPGFVMIVSMWYRREEQAGRIAFWLAANGVTTIICSPIAYGLSGLVHPAIESWRILYILFGMITFCTGCFYLWALPDSPISVGWLNEREKSIAVDRIKENLQGIGNYTWKWEQDPRTYCYFLFSMFQNIPNGGIGTFGAIIVNSFGYSSRISLLLQMPLGLVDTGCKLIFMNLSDYYRDRTAFGMAAMCLPFMGGLIMLLGPQIDKGLLLFGYALMGAAGTGWGLTMASLSGNTVGYTKKATANGVQIIAYGIGNWLGPQTFRASTAPHYRTGKTVLCIFLGLTIVDLFVLRMINWTANKKRDRLAVEDPANNVQPEDAAARDLTDFQQPQFRYML